MLYVTHLEVMAVQKGRQNVLLTGHQELMASYCITRHLTLSGSQTFNHTFKQVCCILFQSLFAMSSCQHSSFGTKGAKDGAETSLRTFSDLVKTFLPKKIGFSM